MMDLLIKRFDELTALELYEILKARAAVFTLEQQICYQDMDDIDLESLHVALRNERGRVEAYLRIYPKQDEPGTVQMGRVLTLHHGNGLGKKLLQSAILAAKERLSAEEIYLESQTHAVGFYERLGFTVTSEEFMEAGIPHVEMRLPGGNMLRQPEDQEDMEE